MDKIQAFDQVDVDKYFSLLVKEIKDYAIFLMTTEGIISSWNEGAELIKGYTKDEAIGNHYRMLFPKRFQESKEPEKEIAKALENGRYEDQQWRIRKNGEEFWARVVLTPIYGENNKLLGLAKITQDLTKEKKSEEKLKAQSEEIRHAKEFSEAVFNTMNEAIIVLDKSSRIVNANNAFISLFHLGDNFINQPLSQSHPRWKEKDLTTMIDEVIKHGKYFQGKEFEFEINGVKKFLNITSKFIRHNQDDKLKILISMVDVTFKHESDIAKSDFLSFVSHELRTPITNVKAYMQLMRKCYLEGTTCDYGRFLDRAISFTDTLSAMVTELHESNKAEAGKIQVNMLDINIDELLNENLEIARMTFPDVQMEKRKYADVTVHADPLRLGQVFSNFLSNAIKYSGGQKVYIDAELEGSCVKVQVIDHGVGIPSDQIKMMFSKYFRASNKMKVEGLGMGLFLAKKIIKAHKGEIGVTSEPGKGSCFYFKVPVVK